MILAGCRDSGASGQPAFPDLPIADRAPANPARIGDLKKLFGGPPDATRVQVGAGFYITGDGMILTAAHVVQDCLQISVRSDTTQPVRVSVIGLETKEDLAVLGARRDDLIAPVALFPPSQSAERIAGLSFQQPGLPLQSADTSGLKAPNPLNNAPQSAAVWIKGGTFDHGDSGTPILEEATGHIIGLLNVVRTKDTASTLRHVDAPTSGAIGYDMIQIFLRHYPDIALAAGQIEVRNLSLEDVRRATVRVACFQGKPLVSPMQQ